ncbi:MAG: AMP-binding protein [Bacteroidales bacterium]|nr:AMP-binding protein [Bacteroidales bacterium]
MTFDEFACEWDSDIPTIEARTSGSTGIPKRILLSKAFVARSARATNAFFSLSEGSRFHSCVAADFIGGKMMFVRAALAKGIFSCETPSNRPLSGLSSADVIDLLAVVPSQMIHILRHVENMPEIRNIIIGGSAIHPDLRHEIAKSGLLCYETYGMTETASHIALRRVTHDVDLPFRIIGNLHIAKDERECLVIEYPEGERIVTNDLVRLVSSDSFLITGRVDDVIVTGGKKLNPCEVEAVLSAEAGCEVVVSSVPDIRWGEKAVAVMPEACKLTEEEIRKTLFSVGFEPWMCPKEIVRVAAFPHTRNGKIDRPALRRRLPELLQSKS